MKKGILILSWCNADDVINYGQILQGCAMMYIIRKISPDQIAYISYSPRNLRELCHGIKKHYSIKYGHVIAYVRTKFFLKKFVLKHKIYFYQLHNRNRVDKIAQKYKYLICGSDQIWHPCNYDQVYFLNFGNREAFRISYAASLPKSNIEINFSQIYESLSQNLRNIDAISVRESASVSLINKLSGKSVQAVLDPVYLVPTDIWYNLTKKIKVNPNYIFVYIPNGMDENMARFIKIIAEKYKIRNVYLLMTRGDNLLDSCIRLNYVDVREFLYLIQYASCIITSSFHAVVFSTIFHKEFYCYDVPNSYRGEDIRLPDLLKKFDLSNRMINNNLHYQDSKINYDEFEIKKKIYLMESFEFLNNSLQI